MIPNIRPSYREKQTIRTKLNVRMLENVAAAHQDFGSDEMCWKERDDFPVKEKLSWLFQ